MAAELAKRGTEFDRILATPAPAQGADVPVMRAMLAHGIADADGYVQMERLQGDTQMAAFHAGRRAAYQQLEAALDNLATRAAAPGNGQSSRGRR